MVQDLKAKREDKDAERLAEAAAAKSVPKDEVQLKKPAGESCCHQIADQPPLLSA